MNDNLQKIENQNRLLSAISEVQNEFIITTEYSKLFDNILKHILQITESEYGFIGKILTDKNNQPYLKTYALTNVAWNDETKEFYEINAPKGLEFTNLKTLFGVCISTRKFVISNNPANDNRKGGLPSGHPPLNSFLAVPFIKGEEMIGMFGIANKKDGYNEELVEFIKPLTETCLNIIVAYEIEQDRKRIETEFLKTKEDWEHIFQAIGHPTIILNDKQQIINVNNAMLKISGKTKEELLNQFCFKEFHPSQLCVPNGCPFHKMQKSNMLETSDMEVEALKGNYLVSCTPVFDENNNLKSVIHIATDITQRKIAENELIFAKVKAEESDNLKTAFLQNMSHEIRTPMNAIIGFSGMLDKPDLSVEKRKSFTIIIQNSTNQLLSIITDILAISSIETKQERVNIDQVCINDIIVDLLAIFKPQAINQNISLYAKQQLTDKQSEIYTDKTKVTQILTNLITNALKFTHEGFIEFGYNLKNDFLEFYVKDSGIGIKPEMQEKIFERFRQADISINKKYGGTGLGLAISKAFIELLGGKIWVQSKLEKGSIFYFTIPYKPIQENDKRYSATLQNDRNITILVAEDGEYNFLFIEEMLKEMNFKLIHAKDGQETVEICKINQEIDLILMDIKMPIMDGYTAAKQIKEFRPDLPIIAQTAYALVDERAKYNGEIFDDYITKPIKENELKQKVQKYIDKIKK